MPAASVPAVRVAAASGAQVVAGSGAQVGGSAEVVPPVDRRDSVRGAPAVRPVAVRPVAVRRRVWRDVVVPEVEWRGLGVAWVAG